MGTEYTQSLAPLYCTYLSKTIPRKFWFIKELFALVTNT